MLIKLYKNAYSGLPKNIWLLSIVMLINRSGTMVIAFLALYCTQHLHTTVQQAGIAMAVYGLGAIVGAIVGGRLSDTLGYKNVQTYSLLIAGILFIATAFLQNYNLFCVFIFLLACANESFRPANASAIAANSTPLIRTRAFSLIRLAMNLGWSIGTTIGGFVCHIDYRLLFWVDGATSLAAGAAFIFLKFSDIAKKDDAVSANKTDEIKDINPYKNKPFIYFILGTLVYTFCFFQLFSNLPLFYKKGLQLDEFVIGIVMAMNGVLIVLIEMLLVKNIEHKHSKKSIIIAGTLGMALFYAANSLYSYFNIFFVAFGGMIIITFAEMLSLPFMNSYYLGYAGKTNTGKYAAIYTMCWSVGQILAGYIGGYVIEHFGFMQLWVSCSILSLVCIGIYYKVIK
ncbi:MAG: MFS transporter [Chitinophagaceae bacterium]